MNPSKNTKALNMIKYHMNSLTDIVTFVKKCEQLSNSYKNAKNSDELNQSVLEAFGICRSIGIAQIFPPVLYDYVSKAYLVVKHEPQNNNQHTGIQFVDNSE